MRSPADESGSNGRDESAYLVCGVQVRIYLYCSDRRDAPREAGAFWCPLGFKIVLMIN